MKRLALIIVLLVACAFLGAEETVATEKTGIVSPNIFGMLFGVYSGSIEFAVGSHFAIAVEPLYFNIKMIPIIGSQIESDFNFWLGSLSLGTNYYFDKTFNSFFLGGYVKGTYFNIGTSPDILSTGSIGVGAKIGYRWLWDWFSLALGAGYEYNKAFASISSAYSDSTTATYTTSIEGGYPFAIINMAIAF